MKRVFVAIELSAQARRQVQDYIQYLQNDLGQLRVGWERAEKLHLTLRFLGSVDSQQLINLTSAVENLADKFSPFRLLLSGAGVFPNAKKAEVLWIEVTDAGEALAQIHQLLEAECQRIGFAGERRNFVPHITVARLRNWENSKRLVEKHLNGCFEPIEFEVLELAVYESILLPTGSSYQVIERARLKRKF